MTNYEIETWKYLMDRLKNPYSAAAIMGNFYIESKMDPGLLQSSYARKLGMTSAEYTAKTDSGEYPADSFIHDSAGYGLAQWTYWSRKLSLLDCAKEKKKSVGDLGLQLDFFWNEVQLYNAVFPVLLSAKSVKEASDIFAKKYEKPADTSETALKRRSDAGQKYYDMFVNQQEKEMAVRVTAKNVNVRIGPGMDKKAICRVQTGDTFQYFGTDDNGWNGIVLWLHPDFSEVVEK